MIYIILAPFIAHYTKRARVKNLKSRLKFIRNILNLIIFCVLLITLFFSYIEDFVFSIIMDQHILVSEIYKTDSGDMEEIFYYKTIDNHRVLKGWVLFFSCAAIVYFSFIYTSEAFNFFKGRRRIEKKIEDINVIGDYLLWENNNKREEALSKIKELPEYKKAIKNIKADKSKVPPRAIDNQKKT